MARIVHLTTVHHVLDPRILFKEAASLAGAGHEVFLIARHDRAETIQGVQILPMPSTGRATGFSGLIVRLARMVKCLRLAWQLYPQVVHFHDPELIPVARFLKRRSTKVIYDVHEDYASRGGLAGRFVRVLEKWCFRWVDHIILAEDGYAQIVADVRTPHSFILNYFLAPEMTVKQDRKKGDALNLLYAGTISNRRGLKNMLDLIEAARNQNRVWRLWLVGKCHIKNERVWAERYLAEKDLGSVVHRVGWSDYVPWKQMVPYFEQADIGLALFDPHPNSERSIPTKFYEYMYFGLPILSSDILRWKEFVTVHGIGVTVPQGDAEAAFQAVDALARDADLWESRSLNGIRAAKDYRWEVMGKRLVELYQHLLESEEVVRR
jgi:glycosyltransferase involved in cell wall biosynthesis